MLCAKFVNFGNDCYRGGSSNGDIVYHSWVLPYYLSYVQLDLQGKWKSSCSVI